MAIAERDVIQQRIVPNGEVLSQREDIIPFQRRLWDEITAETDDGTEYRFATFKEVVGEVFKEGLESLPDSMRREKFKMLYNQSLLDRDDLWHKIKEGLKGSTQKGTILTNLVCDIQTNPLYRHLNKHQLYLVIHSQVSLTDVREMSRSILPEESDDAILSRIKNRTGRRSKFNFSRAHLISQGMDPDVVINILDGISSDISGQLSATYNELVDKLFLPGSSKITQDIQGRKEYKNHIASGSADSHEEFTQIVEEYRKRIFVFAYRLAKDVNEAEDIVQDTFINAYASFSRLSSRDKLNNWLFKIAANVFYDRLRGNSGHRRKAVFEPVEDYDSLLQDHDFSVDPLNNVVNAEESALVTKVLNKIPSIFRLVLILSDYGELSYSEIAEVLQIPEGTVKSSLSRARERFRNSYSELAEAA